MKSTIDLSRAEWVKSSYSSQNGGACVECAGNIALASGVVPVRDSKDLTGPVLAFSAGGWSGFVSAVVGGELTAH
jgi:hypothetical protein